MYNLPNDFGEKKRMKKWAAVGQVVGTDGTKANNRQFLAISNQDAEERRPVYAPVYNREVST
jgi:hypothetical protein